MQNNSNVFLLSHCSSTENKPMVEIWNDLTYKLEEDEIDMLEYSQMTTLTRSKYALERAGRILHSVSNENERYIVLLSDEEKEDHNEEDILRSFTLSSINDLLQMLHRRWNIFTPIQLAHFLKISKYCEEQFKLRNSPTQSISSPFSKAIEFFTETDIQQGLQNKSFQKAILSIPKRFKGEPYVILSQIKYYLQDSSNIRAFQGDTIVVKALPRSEWQPAPVGAYRLLSSSTTSENINRNDEIEEQSRPPVPTAKFITIFEESGRRDIVATFQQQQQDSSESKIKNPLQGGGDMVLVTPMDVRYPKIRISGKNRQQWANHRILIRIDSWDEGDSYANGHLLRLVGPVGDLEAEVS